MDEEPVLVTNAIQEEDRKTSATLMYMKPTTMRGIPLDSLTSSPRGFYITRSDDLSSSTFAGDFTSSYTTIDSSVERQTETDLISTTDETVAHINQNDIGTDEIVTVTRNYQKELELAIFNNVHDIIKSKDVDNREEKSSTFNSLENSDSTENPSIYKEPDTVTIPVSRPTSKREKLLRNFDHNTTPSSNVYAFSPARSTGRRFTLGVVRQPHYNEANIPLWTGKRIVARKRNRTVSQKVERRIDEDVSYTTMNIFENASTLTLAKPKLTPISTTPTIPASIASEFTSSKILDVNSDSIESEEGAITLTNSIIAATPSVSKISSVTSDFTTTIISTISDDFTSVTEIPSTANEAIITTTPSSTDAVVKAPMIASDQATIAIESAIKSAGIEFPVFTTANYSTADVPTTASTHAIANDSVIIPVTTSIGVEITSSNANHSTDFANMVVPATASAEVQITSPITNYSVTTPTNTNAIPTDSAPVITISAGNDIISTDSVVAIDSTITTSATTSTEVETSTITNNPSLVIPATSSPSTNTSSSTIISSTHATISATTSNLLLDTVTVRNMLTTITTPAAVIIPTINDSNVITSADVNVSSNFAITDTLTTLSRPRSSSVISSKDFVTSTRSIVPTTLIESTTTHFNSSDFNISNNSKISVTTAKSIQTTEIPTTIETSPIFTSTVISRSLPSTNSAISSQMRPIITQTPSTLFSIVTSINNNTATVEKSTNDESIATSISQTTDIYEPSSVQTTSEESTTSRRKVISKEGASRAINRKQDEASKVDDQIGQKTSRRRVVNRKNNWLGRPVVHQTINRNPLHRVTLHRGGSRRPPGFTSRVVEQNHRRRITQKRTRVNFQPIDTTIRPDEDVVQNSTEAHNRERSVRRRIVSKRIREKVEKETTTLEAIPLLSQSTENETLHGNLKEARADPDFVDTTFQGNFSINFHVNRNFSNKGNKGRRMRVLLKSIRPKSEENNSTTEKISTDIIERNIQNNLSTNLTISTSKNLADERKTRRRMRIVRKKIRPKFEEEEAKTEKTSTDSDSTDESLRGAFSNNFRRGKNFPGDYEPRRRLRVVLKSIKPKSEEGNSTAKGTSNVNLFDEEETRKNQPASEEKDSVAEETFAHYDFTDEVFSSNLYVDDKLPDREKMMEDTEEPQTTETFVLVKEDTDQPSLEVNSLRNGGSIGRTTGYSTRYRKPTPSTTNVPLINTFPSTVAIYRKGRPIETTFSSRIDLIDAYENSGPTAIQNDQKAEVSDQSIRAQEFAVTLTDPPLSSSDTGRTLLRDAARRKISTTVAPRTDPAIDRTVISRPRFDDDSRNRQRPRTKNAPTVNSTTRPRRPPVLDYDYYEDETPIVIGKPVLNSKLFLTSKGTIRCLDQGNFPHPYSCKKFITCARMVNGQVIGTEYTCPDKLTFDPIGGICNWSAGLGCKV